MAKRGQTDLSCFFTKKLRSGTGMSELPSIYKVIFNFNSGSLITRSLNRREISVLLALKSGSKLTVFVLIVARIKSKK